MKDKFFSVIITTYNSEKNIENTVNSVFKQNYLNYEVILVDDCSTDNTLKVVNEKFGDRINIFKTNENFGGPARSRNIGLNNSKGEWIFFLDGDDFWFRNKLINFNKFILENPNFEVFCSNELLLNTKNKKRIKINHGPYVKNFFEKLLIEGNKLSPSASAVKKDFIFNKKILFDENKCLIGVEDYDFWLNLSKNSAKFFFIKKVMNIYLIHDRNLTNNKNMHLKNTIKVIDKNISFLNNKNKSRVYSLIIFRVKISYFLDKIRNKEKIFYNMSRIFVNIILHPYNFIKFLNQKLK